MFRRAKNNLTRHERTLVSICIRCLAATVVNGVKPTAVSITQEERTLCITVVSTHFPAPEVIEVTEEAILKMLSVGQSNVKKAKIIFTEP